MLPWLVRPETPADAHAIYAVNSAAFPSRAEADLVDRLRAEAEPFVSLVAVLDGAVVGHIAFSPVTLDALSGRRIAGLGPMAVAPAHQRRGIGSSLVRAGLDTCRALGFAALVVLGHPGFYPRFGFAPSVRFGFRGEYEVADDLFMALELVPGALHGAAGTVRYHPAFGTV